MWLPKNDRDEDDYTSIKVLIIRKSNVKKN